MSNFRSHEAKKQNSAVATLAVPHGNWKTDGKIVSNEEAVSVFRIVQFIRRYEKTPVRSKYVCMYLMIGKVQIAQKRPYWGQNRHK